MADFSDYAVYFDGSALDGAVGDVTRTVVLGPTVEPADLMVPEVEIWGGHRLPLPDPITGPSVIRAVIEGEYTGAGNNLTATRALEDDWSLLNQKFTPWVGTKELEVRRKDASAANVYRVIDVRALALPYMHRLANAEDETAAIWCAALKYRYPIVLRAPHGLWKDDADQSDSDSFGASTGTVTVDNSDGEAPAYLRFEFARTGGSGSIGYTLADGAGNWTVAGTVTDGDWVDFGHTTPGVLDASNTTGVVTAGSSWIEIPALTSDDITMTRTSGTATFTGTVKYRRKYGSW